MLKIDELQSELQADLQAISQMQQQWMVGTGDVSGPQPPASLQPLLEGLTPAQMRLWTFALMTQMQMVVQAPEQDVSDANVKPALPQLNLPTLPTEMRPLFRQALKQLQPTDGLTHAVLLRLLASRAVTAHPDDWLPAKADQDLPAVYWPWSRWQANKPEVLEQISALTADTWDEFFPAERLQLLREMRKHNAAQARDLISQCAAHEPAEKRVNIISTLEVNLSEDDAGYLKQLLTDRSQKVVRHAYNMLNRLAPQNNAEALNISSEKVKELAEGFIVKKEGLLKRRLIITPVKLKNSKQNVTRTELLSEVPLPAFAESLGVSVEQLLNGWQFDVNHYGDNNAFITNAAATLNEEQLHLLLTRLLAKLPSDVNPVYLLESLFTRISEYEREQCVKQLLSLKVDHFSFVSCISLLKQPATSLSMLELKTSASWKTLEAYLREEFAGGYLDDHTTSLQLAALGLLLPQTCANEALNALLAKGLSPSDPALSILKINQMLPQAPKPHDKELP